MIGGVNENNQGNEPDIVKFLEPLSQEEIDTLKSFCLSRDKSLLPHLVREIASLVKRYRLRDLIPLLKSLYEEGQLSEYDKREVYPILLVSLPLAKQIG